MPSKLKKAIAAMKDQTSIGLARVGGHESSALEVAVLKSTTHDPDDPPDPRHVADVLRLVSSSRSFAGCCARAIGRRAGRTRSWAVALKSLMLVLRVVRAGDPYFPREVHQLRRRRRGWVGETASFREGEEDLKGFVKGVGVYVEEKVECLVSGRLNLTRRRSYGGGGGGSGGGYRWRRKETALKDMKPAVLIDRICHWQWLLDRAMATRPTGPARNNCLVQACLHAILHETFDLHRDISDGLSLLLDGFFNLPYNHCITVYNICIKASKQFEDLDGFYDLARSIGVGRSSEYSIVRRVSDQLIGSLHEFLRDKAEAKSFLSEANRRTLGVHPKFGVRDPGSDPIEHRVSEKLIGSLHDFLKDKVKESFLCEANRRTVGVHPSLGTEFGVRESGSGSGSESGSGSGSESQCMSLEELMSMDPRFSPERYSDPGGSVKSEPIFLPGFCVHDGSFRVRGFGPTTENVKKRTKKKKMDLLGLEDSDPQPKTPRKEPEKKKSEVEDEDEKPLEEAKGWELALLEGTSQQGNNANKDRNQDRFWDDIDGYEFWLPSEQNYNPFLQDSTDLGFSFDYSMERFFEVDNGIGYGEANAIGNFSSGFSIEPSLFGNVNGNHNAGLFGHDPNQVSREEVSRDTTRAIVQYGQVGLGKNVQHGPFGSPVSDHEQRMSGTGSLAMAPFSQVGLGQNEHDGPFRSPISDHEQRMSSQSLAMVQFDQVGPYDNKHHSPFGSPLSGHEQRMSSGSLAMVQFGQVGPYDNQHNGPFGSPLGHEQSRMNSGSLAMVQFGQVGLGKNECNGPFGSPISDHEQRMSNGTLAMVPFGQVSIDDHFSHGPTFRAKGLDLDTRGSNNREDNPFGSVPNYGDRFQRVSSGSRAMVPFGQVGHAFGTTEMEQRPSSGCLAVVPFGQMGAEDLSSPSSSYSTTPTFQATGLAMGPCDGRQQRMNDAWVVF